MSIIEIANRTGISKSTVSRVLNNGSVSDAKRRIIEQAIKELGYKVPEVRRGPKRHKRRGKALVGVLFLSDDYRLMQNPETYYPALLHSLITCTRQDELEISPRYLIPTTLEGENLDKYSGFILFGPCPKDGNLPVQVKKLVTRMPSVYIQSEAINETPSNPLEQIDRVFYENQMIGCIAAKYLINKGHKHPALICPYFRHPIHDTRINSFSMTCRYHHVEAALYVAEKTLASSPTYAHVDQMVGQMIENVPLPDGLFVTADIRTVHTYGALLSRGIKPMEDIDIISCNNTPFFTEQMNPKPAEIDLNIAGVGYTAIEVLKQRIDYKNAPAKTVLVRPELVIN